VPTGLHIASAYDHDGVAKCLGVESFTCQEAVHSFNSRFDSLSSLLGWLTLVPGLVGVLLAAPFIVEFEQGTYRLGWTQSITRRRWIVTKLGLAVAAALAVSLIFTLLLTWWHAPFVHIDGRMGNEIYDSEGTVVFGYTLFALALATVVGVIWRKVVPALVVGFGGYFVARIFVDVSLRQRLLPAHEATWPLNGTAPKSLTNAWVITQYPSNAHGESVKAFAGPCLQGAGPGSVKANIQDCLAQHGVYMHAVYQPASRFWALQGVETALFAGTALALLAFAVWWTLRRID